MTRDEGEAARPGWPDRACDAFVWGFGAWTLCAHAVVALGGGLRQLLLLAAAALVASLGALWWRRGQPAGVAPEPLPAAQPDGLPPLALVAGLATAAGLVALLSVSGNLAPFWVGAVTLLGLLLAAELRARPGPLARARAPRHDAALLVLCLLSAVVTLVAHRPDADDAWLLNLAVGAADAPDAPLLARDTLHGLPGLPAGIPAGLPTYRLHAIELLAGALAWLTPLRVIDAAHLLLPALAALLVPLAHARLLRLLVPGRWIWAVGFALAFLLLVGDTHMAYGNFAFVRLHQGKSVLLCVALPLVAAYAMEFAQDPRPARLARLAAAQVAAVGVSASALWIAPPVAAFALVCAMPIGWAGLRVLGMGLVASGYLVALGLTMAGAARATLAEYALHYDVTHLAQHAQGVVLGYGPAAWLALLVVLGSWCVASGGAARRFALVFPLGFLLFFWSPFTAPLVAEYVTSPPTYWRVFWILPLPALAGIVLSAPLALGSRPLGAALAAALAVGALWVAPSRSTLSSENRVRLGAPGPKAPRDVFAAAEALARQAPAGAPVLAPYRVATWVSTLHAHPVPLAVRSDYLLSLQARLGEAEVARRGRLVALVSGTARDPEDTSLLDAALGGLSAVCVAEAATPAVRRSLASAGFGLVEGVAGYEIWAPR